MKDSTDQIHTTTTTTTTTKDISTTTTTTTTAIFTITNNINNTPLSNNSNNNNSSNNNSITQFSFNPTDTTILALDTNRNSNINSSNSNNNGSNSNINSNNINNNSGNSNINSSNSNRSNNSNSNNKNSHNTSVSNNSNSNSSNNNNTGNTSISNSNNNNKNKEIIIKNKGKNKSNNKRDKKNNYKNNNKSNNNNTDNNNIKNNNNCDGFRLVNTMTAMTTSRQLVDVRMSTTDTSSTTKRVLSTSTGFTFGNEYIVFIIIGCMILFFMVCLPIDFYNYHKRRKHKKERQGTSMVYTRTGRRPFIETNSEETQQTEHVKQKRPLFKFMSLVTLLKKKPTTSDEQIEGIVDEGVTPSTSTKSMSVSTMYCNTVGSPAEHIELPELPFENERKSKERQ